jgi:hypothetical protein
MDFHAAFLIYAITIFIYRYCRIVAKRPVMVFITVAKPLRHRHKIVTEPFGLKCEIYGYFRRYFGFLTLSNLFFINKPKFNLN